MQTRVYKDWHTGVQLPPELKPLTAPCFAPCTVLKLPAELLLLYPCRLLHCLLSCHLLGRPAQQQTAYTGKDN